ncbi:SUKH-4 family immunity protein [Streptomyces niveus]|uniref:SUKH-4 family immunity protein n=1 Tax=Streptomyces niveus TaxID=193462 RepID=UPI00371997BC
MADFDDEDSVTFSLVLLHEPSENLAGGEGLALNVAARSLGGVYRASGHLQRVSIGGKEFVRFGSTGLFGSVVLDPESGRVLQAGKRMNEGTLVNTSLDNFNECIEAFIGLRHLCSGESDDDWGRAAEELDGIVLGIDAEAHAVHNGFWHELRWDIANGDFAD